MEKWVGVEFHRVVSARSWKGHLKITARSNQRKTRAKKISTLMFSLNVYDCLKHTYTPTQNIPKHLNRSKDNNKRGWKGYTLSNHPCVTLVNFESCVWRTVSPHSSHHPQEVLLAQFSLYVHKGGLKPDSFHF